MTLRTIGTMRRSAGQASAAMAVAAMALLHPLAAYAQTETQTPETGEAQADAPDTAVPALPAPPVDNGPTQEARPAPAIAAPSAGAARGPASVADLAEGLLDAVVNISTSQSVDVAGRGVPPLEAPEGSPLQDFFDDLLQDRDGLGNRRVQSLGSGFVVDPSGVVVTNNHVIADADTITVNFADGTQLDAELIGTDPKTDLAVLKVEPEEPLVSVKFGDSEALRIGDWVMAIGNPFGLGGSVSIGIVSARGRNINAGPYDNFIQTDAAINRGNSGGPLFDLNGDVVGINTAIISPSGGSIGIGFSVPSNLAVNVIDQLREFGETRRGWLGIRLQAVTDDIAEGLGIGEARGAVVMGIVEGGPSDNGLLKVGDVIVSFDGAAVESSRDLPRIVAETPVGKAVAVEVLRKTATDKPAERTSVEVTLGRLEDGEKLMAESDDAAPTSDPEAAETGDTDAGPVETLGMTLTEIDPTLREQYALAEDAKGVVITAVAPSSNAAEKGIEAGTLIREVAQEEVATAREVADKIAKLKDEGRRNALLLLAASNGDLRFVVVPIE
ncbi:Do family serine endopeptidase [Aurantimonas manganoxydans]|uniref:Do family serine endopeptidase n=1 Tax=Aurantimonas manganoxydans TaxID=651183 RepID=UPI0002D53A15|nr:Do family serine endopeptidase [Aurantimonas manganoxydans]